ncbi:helix-turn-helix transcriptional regulator [Asinibacterium sp. OR53]|uniref:helix-turn-helix domain-containing protein n=1 Tax=Asinibacterium sp. OR53 TaxID=925409 RepID=UPI00055F1818
MNYKFDEAYLKAFGNQLRKIRTAKGMSMRKLAFECDMEYSQLSKIERAVINTTISTVHALAQALGVPEKDLFDFKVKAK